MSTEPLPNGKNLYTQLPGNPFLRRALDPSRVASERQVYATLAQAHEQHTLALLTQEHQIVEHMRHGLGGHTTPEAERLVHVRNEILERLTPNPDD